MRGSLLFWMACMEKIIKVMAKVVDEYISGKDFEKGGCARQGRIRAENTDHATKNHTTMDGRKKNQGGFKHVTSY